MSLPHFFTSDIGKARSNNEDFILVSPNYPLFIVADGIGGHNFGEVASKKACEVIEQKFSQILQLSPLQDLETAQAAIKFAIHSANKAIYQMALDQPAYQGMGTTVALLYKFENHLIVAHVGDSRVYACQDTLVQLTSDHTMFASKSPKTRSLRPRHYLTKSLGIKDFVEPTLSLFPFDPSTTYLLCSDGLSDYLNEKSLLSLLKERLSLEEKSNKILSSVLATPAKDNISFILIDPTADCLIK